VRREGVRMKPRMEEVVEKTAPMEEWHGSMNEGGVREECERWYRRNSEARKEERMEVQSRYMHPGGTNSKED